MNKPICWMPETDVTEEGWYIAANPTAYKERKLEEPCYVVRTPEGMKYRGEEKGIGNAFGQCPKTKGRIFFGPIPFPTRESAISLG
jgi:hypothetical protein